MSALAIAIATTLLGGLARGDAPAANASAHHARRHHEHPRPPSLSMGYANGGRLQNAACLHEDEALRFLPGRVLHYGTDELTGLLTRAAHSVFRHHHVRMTVGDLSAARGGPVGHHASHQSGRDADVGFFVIDRHGESVALGDFVAFGRDGNALLGGALRFDTPRNWALIEALLGDPLIHVEQVFVSNPLRALLLAYGREHGASSWFMTHAENVLRQPARGSPHANHFHVRIACPHDDTACVEGVRLPPRRHRADRRVAGNTRRAHADRHAPANTPAPVNPTDDRPDG